MSLRTWKALVWQVRERLRACPPESLLHHASSRYSQNGEDGMLRELFRRIGPGQRRFVEFGVGDGTQCNTRALAEDGWTGVWLEADSELARAAHEEAPPGVRVFHRFLTRENVAATLAEVGVSRNVDLLSIDVDGNDYHLWRALLPLQARAVVIEYNASREPGVEWVMPYDPDHRWDLTDHFGASLDALARLSPDYHLVACDAQGVNAFFVRGDASAFFAPGDVSHHYMSPKYCGLAFGHPPR